jgi:geranylgeranyl reductase family protein
MIHDVIVVGSGPGGATAAAVLAASGRSVLLADRQSFPRDKVCGDGMPVEIMGLLRHLGVDTQAAELQYRRITSLSITAPNGRTVTLEETPRDVFSMTAPRFSFDHMLHQHALRSGARFEVMAVHEPLLDPRGRVAGVVERRGGQRIEHEARLVICAGGVAAPIARALDGQRPGATAIAVRAYARLIRPQAAHVRFFFLPDLLPGYAWVFPTASHRANLGVYVHQDGDHGGRWLRDRLAAFCDWLTAEHGYRLEIEPDTIKSWSLPLYVSPDSRALPGALLVGDEGRFVNALTGGGIYTAMLTGQQAARAALRLLDAQPADYDAAWRSAVAADLRRGRFIQRHIASRAPLFNALVSLAAHPRFTYQVMKAIAGDHY